MIKFCTTLAAAALVWLGPATAHAHAFGERYDLPLPLWLYLVGAGAAVGFSFLILAIFARGAAGSSGYPAFNLLRLAVVRPLASLPVLGAVRGLSAALFVFLLIAGFFGNQDGAFENIVPTAVWVIWWVGLAYVSALLGDLWSLINPWKIFSVWTEALVRRLDAQNATSMGFALPAKLGIWPAVILFAIFSWMELVWTERDSPSGVATLIIAYSAITWGGMYLFGREQWLHRGEAFTVLYGLFARFAPFDARIVRTEDGARREWNLRPPAVGLLSSGRATLAMTAFVILTLSTVTLDGLIESPLWAKTTYWVLSYISPERIPALGFMSPSTMVLTAGVILAPLLLFSIYAVFSQAIVWAIPERTAAAATSHRLTAMGMARVFVWTLVPIAIAYHLAHFLSFFLVFGQFVIPLASDPLGYGWDLFGTADYQVNIGIVGARFVWITSVLAIVAGHVAAVYLAHVAALRTFADRRLAMITQYPMLLLMIAYTITSLWILSQPIVE